MFVQTYRLDELKFAFCYRLYLRWRTHRAKPLSAMARLDQPVLKEIGDRFDIRVLETSSSNTDVLLLVSLEPPESVAICASKLKGQLSKWLREQLKVSAPTNLLSKGYFAYTTGKSTREAVNRYLDSQGEHHGYADRARPPVFVGRYELSAGDAERIRAKHACTILQHHIVLATWRRQGVFGQQSAEAVAERWRELLSHQLAALVKVSFVPDHAHIAVRVHPSVAPAELIVAMMTAAQELMIQDYADSVIRAGVERLWQPSAYLGSYGDLQSAKIAAYIKNWKKVTERE